MGVRVAKRLLTVVMVLCAAAASAQIATMPYRWNYGDPVYGHEVNWNFDQMNTNTTAWLATLTYILGLTTADNTKLASFTTTAASTTQNLIWDENASNSVPMVGSGAFSFSSVITFAGNGLLSGGINLEGVVGFTTASGAYFAGDTIETFWAIPSKSFGCVASCSVVSGALRFSLIASAPAGIKINSRTRFVNSTF